MHNGMDERQMQINTKAVAFGGIFLAVCVAVSMIVRLVRTEELGWEFWALLGMSGVIVAAGYFQGDVEQPKSISGKVLPTGSSAGERKLRNKDYAIRALIFAGTFSALDALVLAFSENENSEFQLAQALFPNLSLPMAVVVGTVIGFAGMFLISYGIDWLVGEKFKVKRYNQMIASLEEE